MCTARKSAPLPTLRCNVAHPVGARLRAALSCVPVRMASKRFHLSMSLTIKICGLRTPEALDVALHAGADMVGFVFFPPSPRHVDFAAARELGARVNGQALKVALFVDAADEWLAASIAALAPDLLQLHGKETPERVLGVKTRFRLPVMKAIAVETRDDLACVPDYAEVADRLIFDARAPRDAWR